MKAPSRTQSSPPDLGSPDGPSTSPAPEAAANESTVEDPIKYSTRVSFKRALPLEVRSFPGGGTGPIYPVMRESHGMIGCVCRSEDEVGCTAKFSKGDTVLAWFAVTNDEPSGEIAIHGCNGILGRMKPWTKKLGRVHIPANLNGNDEVATPPQQRGHFFDFKECQPAVSLCWCNFILLGLPQRCCLCMQCRMLCAPLATGVKRVGNDEIVADYKIEHDVLGAVEINLGGVPPEE